MRHVRYENGGKVQHTLVFDSPVEVGDMVVRAAYETDLLWYLKSAFSGDGERMSRTEWLGRDDIAGWGDVRKAFENPWPAGEERVNRLVRQLDGVTLAVPRDIRRRPCWRDDGCGDLDIDRFQSGQPAWRGPNRREVVGRQFMTVVIDLCTGKDVRADAMFWRSAVAVALAAKLEEFGYGVEIAVVAATFDVLEPPGYDGPRVKLEDYQGFTGYRTDRRGRPEWVCVPARRPPGRDQDVSTVVWVKRAGEPIDVGTLVSAVSPWFFRTVVFGSWGLIPNTRPYAWLGHVGVPREEWLAEYANGPGERVLIRDLWTEYAAAVALRETVEQFADRDGLPAAGGGFDAEE